MRRNNMNNANLPKEIKDELIDLTGLTDEEKLEKMKEIFSNSENRGSTQVWEEYHSFHKKLNQVSHRRKNFHKKPIPAYVKQFGVGKVNVNNTRDK